MDLLIYTIVGLAALIFFGVGIIRTAFTDTAGSGNPSQGSVKKDSPQKDSKLPYIRRSSLLTPNEHSFFRVLQPMVEPHWCLFSKVRIEDIIEVPRSIEFREKQKLRGHIKSRHVDFVICDAKTLEVLMCIELDDKSHQRAKTKEADAYNDRAMRDAGVPLIRVPARQAYSHEYVKSHIFEDGVTPQNDQFEPAVSTDPDIEAPNAHWKPPVTSHCTTAKT